MRRETNRWKGAVLGALAGAAGLAAMRWYFRSAAPVLDRVVGGSADERKPPSGPLGDIALIEQVFEEGETSTAALGRLTYRALWGREPRTKESRELVSYLVHWAYGVLQGAVWGAARSGSREPDLRCGAAFGVGLWAVGDELVVPLLGLQEGPGRASAATHVNRFGAHVCYGAATELAFQVLRRLV